MKEFEDDDPMELQGMMMPERDPEVQAAVIIEEFLSMGMPEKRVLELFKDPFYLGTSQLCSILGEERIAELIQECRSGVLRIARID